MTTLSLKALVANTTAVEITEGVITSTGLVYSAYQQNASINIEAMTTAFNVYKSIKGALASCIGSMSVADINKFAFNAVQGKTVDEIEDIILDINGIISSKRQQSMLSSRTILAADKPFEGLCLGVAKKKKGQARVLSNLYTMINIQRDSSLDRFNSQNTLADNLFTRTLGLVDAGKNKYDLDTLIESVTEQNCLMPKYEAMLTAKTVEINNLYDEAKLAEKPEIEQVENNIADHADSKKDEGETTPDERALMAMFEIMKQMSSVEVMRQALAELTTAVDDIEIEQGLQATA